jgi:hypothetical protein
MVGSRWQKPEDKKNQRIAKKEKKITDGKFRKKNPDI